MSQFNLVLIRAHYHEQQGAEVPNTGITEYLYSNTLCRTILTYLADTPNVSVDYIEGISRADKNLQIAKLNKKIDLCIEPHFNAGSTTDFYSLILANELAQPFAQILRSIWNPPYRNIIGDGGSIKWGRRGESFFKHPFPCIMTEPFFAECPEAQKLTSAGGIIQLTAEICFSIIEYKKTLT